MDVVAWFIDYPPHLKALVTADLDQYLERDEKAFIFFQNLLEQQLTTVILRVIGIWAQTVSSKGRSKDKNI
jgi:hypothetical protein